MAALTAASPTSQAGPDIAVRHVWTLAQAQGRAAERVTEGLQGWPVAGPGDAKGPSYGPNLLFF